MKNYFDQPLPYNVWTPNWTKRIIVLVNMAKDKAKFLDIVNKEIGPNAIWELSTSSNKPDYTIN